MSVRTKDEIADQVGDALDILEDCDFTRGAEIARANREAIIALRRLHEELMVGRVEREKSRRRKDRARRLSTGAEVPLWGGDGGE